MWELNAVNVIFIMLINSCMPFIFLGYFITFLDASVFLQTHREILELTRALTNTMYMRARVDQGMHKIGRKGERIA